MKEKCEWCGEVSFLTSHHVHYGKTRCGVIIEAGVTVNICNKCHYYHHKHTQTWQHLYNVPRMWMKKWCVTCQSWIDMSKYANPKIRLCPVCSNIRIKSFLRFGTGVR